MNFSFKVFLALTVPTIWIYYIFVADSLSPWPWYREAFGNGKHYLDLYYEQNPNGWLLGERPLSFDGYLITATEEKPVNGLRFRKDGKVWYVFQDSKQEYLAELKPPIAGCEPRLKVHQNKMGGTLQAAFCP